MGECNQQWVKLMAGDSDQGLSRACTQYECSSKVDTAAAQAAVSAAAAPGETVPLESVVDKWHYVKA